MQTLNSTTTVTSDSGQQSATASVGVNDQPLNPTYVSTGLTNNPLIDSFFLPLVLGIIAVALYRSGYIGIPKWARLIQMGNKENRAQVKLQNKISQIKEKETPF